MTSPLLQSLNPEQLEAVTAPSSNMLVLAGAGTGKTRVLVHRAAWLIEDQGVSPGRLLQVTFTNRAAREMRTRMDSLLGSGRPSTWLGTFHSIGYRLLRQHSEEAGLPKGFTILDAADQRRVVRQILRDGGHEWGEGLKESIGVNLIGSWKDRGWGPDQVPPDTDNGNLSLGAWVRVFRLYQKQCNDNGWVDFADLLGRTYDLLSQDAQLLQRYQEQFSHILVDEFQDTNTVQYDLIALLCGGDSACVMAVGDDDQSIYGWRGASADNMQRFLNEYSDVMLVRLERNYRSTHAILNIANQLVTNNSVRVGKQLRAEGEEGEPVDYFVARDSREEAQFVVQSIENWINAGGSLADVAVLYRNNVLSRGIEQALMSARLQYRIYGGHRFFERAAVRDAMAYVRLAASPDDDSALVRAINCPRRGVGDSTLRRLQECAEEHGTSLWRALPELSTSGVAGRGIKEFVDIVEELCKLRSSGVSPSELVKCVLDITALANWYSGDMKEDAANNLDELRGCANGLAADFTDADDDEDAISRFIAAATLDPGDRGDEDAGDAVKLMTLHSAKGLEFPMVFIIALEDGVLPSERSMQERDDVEEERRLFYVGITRAMRKLNLTRCEFRDLYGNRRYQKASRFATELPSEHIRVLRPVQDFELKPSSENVGGFVTGALVNHRKFGQGVIIGSEGSGEALRLQVNFRHAGSRWLMARIANLELQS